MLNYLETPQHRKRHNMNLEETSQLLIIASAYDNRNVTAEQITAWHDALHDIDYTYAAEGVKMHFKISAEYLKPAHVRANAKTIANEKQARHMPQLTRTPVPQPHCRHGQLLLSCATCCNALAMIDGQPCQHEHNQINCKPCTESIYK